jgi:hypothetical protein
LLDLIDLEEELYSKSDNLKEKKITKLYIRKKEIKRRKGENSKIKNKN